MTVPVRPARITLVGARRCLAGFKPARGRVTDPPLRTAGDVPVLGAHCPAPTKIPGAADPAPTRRWLLAMAAGLALAACGRKGGLEPPAGADPAPPRRYPVR
ncbi:MAG: LPS translocon maturation chaperone LptM [Pseudomonadota bacterium]